MIDKVNMKKRLDYFDQLKGLTIILVVVGYILSFSFGEGDAWLNRLFIIFRMPIFFYISGYWAYKNYDLFTDVLKKLFKASHHLLIPFFVFCFLYSQFVDTKFIDFLSFGGGGYWFLQVIFVLQLFFLVYGHCIREVKNDVLYISLLVVPYAFLILADNCQLIGSSWSEALNVPNLVNYYRYFLLGWLCRKYYKLFELLFKNKLIFAIGAFLYLAKWYFYGVNNMLLSFLGSIGAIVMLQQFFMHYSESQNKGLKLLTYLGQNTMIIYLVHYFFIPDLVEVVKPLMAGDNMFIVTLTLSLLVAFPIILACLLLGKIFESNKYLSFVFLGKR